MAKLSFKNLVLIGFLLGVFVAKVFRTTDFSNLMSLVFLKEWGWQFFWWLAGGVVGWQIIIIDQLLWIYFTYPDQKVSLYIKDLVRQKKFRLVLNELAKYKNLQVHLTSRSVLFQVAWAVLAIFAITSTTSFFGKGLVMTLGLYFLFDNWQLEQQNPAVLNAWLFWQIKRPVSQTEQKWYLWVMTGIFGILCLLI